MTYDMDSIVEATSLSHVTDIATNPPPHPNAPADYPRLPLVLYIARVPGSRDVFLTPIKPREKVVTAEDVQSSLYYVHVNSHEDYEEPPRRPSSVNTDASQLLPVREDVSKRKPALPARPVQPPSPPYPAYDSMPDIQQPPAFPPRPHQISRKAVGTNNQRQTPDLPALPRRPLPSPPQEEDDLDAHSLHQSNVRLLRRADHSEENNPYLRRYEQTPPPIDPANMPEPGTLTLIRRDPSSNEQWNVASIHDPPVQEVSSAALRNPSAAKRTKRGGAPVYLDISNPAYGQFIDQNRPDSRVSMGSTASSDSDPPPEGIFRRRLYMPGSKYGEHNYGHTRKFGSVGSLTPSDESSIRRTMRHSVDMSNTSSSSATADRRSKSYTFTSPWDGRCEFSTGTTGKSLKCRHQLPTNRGSITQVSELRFNLPTSQSRTATALSDKRSSYFHRMHGRAISSEDGSDGTPTFVIREDGRLDLTLGQERAGGGFGGKQAKLGKLIVEPEGLKMLDLLVAANVGLWWRVYEKV